MSGTRRLLAAAALLATALVLPVSLAPTSTASVVSAPLSQSGRWITDATGRVVVLHGLNQVYKVSPYEPSAAGFGADDAAFLAANGFDAMRLGVIWAAVEPQPGHYDDTYLDSIAATVHTLAAHGIVSILDFHQDLYNEEFQGEGAPAWAVADGTVGGLPLPNPQLGFPGNYLANPAEWHTWDQFWANAPGPDGIGLQDHYAATWAHVAARFAADPDVAGYEIMNEPWPGSLGEVCAAPLVGCPVFDAGPLTRFFKRVDRAIRAVDGTHTVYIEPNVLFSQSDRSYVRPIGDPRAGFAFHDYCSTEEVTANNALCPPQDKTTVADGNRYAQHHSMPPLITEFGATNDLANIAEMVGLADRFRLGWLEWAYTGNDKTSASPDGQALVLDPSRPPTGTNVLTEKLKTLAEPYPQALAGTPTSWSVSRGTFKLAYSTARADGAGAFPTGAETDVAVPPIRYPSGYRVHVSGARVVSAANAGVLRLRSTARATSVTLTVTPA